jgi:hypothetical protein
MNHMTANICRATLSVLAGLSLSAPGAETPDRVPTVVEAAASPVSWIEAEAYESQRGSTAPKFTLPTASGGACVDNDWGGQAGHFLRYKVALASNCSVLHVTLRYARETAGDACVSVTLDGKPRPQLRHTVKVAGGGSVSFDLQFLGEGGARDEAYAAAAQVWQEKLAAATPSTLPNPRLQYAYEAALRQMRMLIEARPDHARILKGLEHYYGANPYDTFQVSRALDAVGLRTDAEELLRHQLQHLKHDGIFEMWETGELRQPGARQWIVQGLAATALWNHYELWRDDAWLREIAPALINAAQATLRARQSHAGVHKQGAVAVEGWLPPIGGDGGLGVGDHWSQNAGPLNGVRIAAAAARKLNLPAAGELQTGWLDFQRAFDKVRTQVALVDPDGMLPAFPGATDAQRTRPLWGVVMSVGAFDAIPIDDPAAVKTLRFIQKNQQGGLHLNLGYSLGVWPYLSAEVALWHLRLGETEAAWRTLRAMVDRASSTGCWYEEIDHQPQRGFGDPADVWAAAEMVYLTRQLLLVEAAKKQNNK